MTAPLPNPAGSRVVLVGVSQYERLDSLSAVRNNLAALRRLFLDPDRWGLPDRHCVVLHQPTTSADVLDVLHAQAAKATDTLLFYFAGHGLVDERDEDELFLALPGAEKKRPNRDSIPYSWIRNEFLDARRPQRKILILDCCYSGRALGRWLSGAETVPDELEIFGTCVFTATASTKKALAPTGHSHTAFTGELIAVLENGIPDGPELLDLDTLYQFIDRRLRSRGWPRPKRAGLDNGGLIAIARNVAYSENVNAAESNPVSLSHPSPGPTSDGLLPQTEPPKQQAAIPPRHKHRAVIDAINLSPSPQKRNSWRDPPPDFDLMLPDFDQVPRPRSASEIRLSLRECLFGTTVTLVHDMPNQCAVCAGQGTVNQTRCSTCAGVGSIPQPHELTVRIPPGVEEGTLLRVPGIATVGPSGRPSDLHIVVRETGLLRRQGQDLHYNLTVPMAFAALGGVASVPTLEERETFRLGRGTQPDTTIFMMGKGIPTADGRTRGDLTVHISVPTPQNLTARERELLAAFVTARPYDRPSASSLFEHRAYVPIAVAALGTTLTFNTSEGDLLVHLRPGIQHGETVEVNGGGRSAYGKTKIQIVVKVPTVESIKERDLLRAFAEERGEMDRRPAPPARPLAVSKQASPQGGFLTRLREIINKAHES